MIVPPFIVRELRLGLRNRGIYKSRLAAAAIAAGFAAFFLLVGLMGSRAWGRSLHHWLFFLGLFYGVLRPAQFCVSLFTDERRVENLELLAITGMGPVDLFLGKMCGGLVVASIDLLAIVPVLAFPFLSGGISLQLYLATIVALPIFLLFSVAAAILASVICQTEAGANILAFALVAAVSLGTPLPYWIGSTLTGAPPFSQTWLSASPGFTGTLIFRQFTTGNAAQFWPAAAMTLVWALLFVLVAQYALKRKWQKLAKSDARGRNRIWRRLVFGSERLRVCLRQLVLERNPFQWLAQRDRRPVLMAWTGIGVICFLWLTGWSVWPKYWPSTVNFFITAILMVMLADAFQRRAAAHCLGESRQTGSIELLLTTPLSPEQVLEGQLAALKAQFRPLRWCMFAIFLLMILSGFLTRTWDAPSTASYLGIWSIFLLWCMRTDRRTAPTAMWIALNTGSSSYAVYRSRGTPWQWLWLFFNLGQLRSFARSMARFPTGSDGEVIVVALILMVALLFFAFGWKRPEKICTNFVKEFRWIAQQPLPERNDPGFKEWKDVSEPFPYA
jgi:hypothetical protein